MAQFSCIMAGSTPYVQGALDALQVKNGPTHGEVMMKQTDLAPWR